MTRAEAFLADEYEESRAEVQRTVAAKLGRERLAGIDLGAAYNEAWHALYLRLAADEPVENRKAFLVTVTYRRALSERRASRADRLAADADLDRFGVEPDLDARLDAELQLRHFVQGLRAELDERELQAATLTYLHGLSRPEAAKVIGIPPRRMEKVMDRAAKRIAAVIDAVRPGELCEELDSPVRAFAVGLLAEDGERYAIARDHLESCPACRRKVLVLRGLGAITPPLPGMLVGLGGAGAVATGTGAAGLGPAGSASSGGAATATGAGAAGKAALVGFGAKLAGLSQKAILLGGALTASTAVVVVGTVYVAGGGLGGDPAGTGAAPVVSRDFAGADEGYVKVPEHHAKRAQRRDRRRTKARHHRRRHKEQSPPAAEKTAEVATAPETTYEAPVEVTPEVAPEATTESTPTESAPPPESTAPTESSKPTTNAAVEFELR